jgi:anaerobic selenocysteine-containing dehydrogenase
VIDPRRTVSRRETDLHLPVLPGQDLPLALGLIGELDRLGALDRSFLAEWGAELEVLLARVAEWPLERTAGTSGVAAEDIRRLAEVWAGSSPAVVRCGWGLERNANGAQAIAAVLALPALTAKFGVRGGGYTLSNNGAARFDRDSLLGPIDGSTRRLNMTQLGRLLAGRAPKPGRGGGGEDLLDPPIQALFVYNANPAVTVPDQEAVLAGLAREDLFTVVHEQVMTDTARYADILLPAVTFLEGHDLRISYGSYVVGGIVPVVEPAGESRSNMRLFADLGRAMGFDDQAFGWSDEDLLRRAADAVSMPGGPADGKRLALGLQQRYDFPGGTPVQFETVFPMTSDGRVHLAPEALGADPYAWQPPTGAGTLALISPASPHLITSTMGEFNLDRLTITLHPDDAASRALVSGLPVRVFNELGEVHCHLVVSDQVRPGVAAMPKGAWRRSSLNGKTSTALCPDHAQVVGDAACFNDARVDVAAL